MTDAHPSIFNNKPTSNETWLNSKIIRRTTTADLQRQGLDNRAEKMGAAANSFRNDLNQKAALRDGMQRKSEEFRRRELDIMQRKAEEYREKLRKKLRPGILD